MRYRYLWIEKDGEYFDIIHRRERIAHLRGKDLEPFAPLDEKLFSSIVKRCIQFDADWEEGRYVTAAIDDDGNVGISICKPWENFSRYDARHISEIDLVHSKDKMKRTIVVQNYWFYREIICAIENVFGKIRFVNR